MCLYKINHEKTKECVFWQLHPFPANMEKKCSDIIIIIGDTLSYEEWNKIKQKNAHGMVRNLVVAAFLAFCPFPVSQPCYGSSYD